MNPINKPLFQLIDGRWFDHAELRECNDNVWRYKNDVIWVSRNGNVWRIVDMETQHIRKCIANIFIGRIHDRLAYLPLLVEELSKRNDKETESG